MVKDLGEDWSFNGWDFFWVITCSILAGAFACYLFIVDYSCIDFQQAAEERQEWRDNRTTIYKLYERLT